MKYVININQTLKNILNMFITIVRFLCQHLLHKIVYLLLSFDNK